MRHKIFVLIIFFGLLSTMAISAKITFSQLKPVYNLGDNISIITNIQAEKDYFGFAEVNMKCNEEKNVHKEYLNLKKGDEKKIESSIFFTDLFQSMTGICTIKANFLESVESANFTISDKIKINLNTKNISTEAGSKITIDGNAEKENGDAI